MKKLLPVILVFVGRLCMANMASPIREGTYSSNAFSSRDIDILKEKIDITIDKNFGTALYVIEYVIRTETDGKQIPLLFHAKDYQGNFRVWMDNKELILLDIPPEYTTSSNSPFEKFSNSLRPASQEYNNETVIIYWQKNSGNVFTLNDLKYFETELSKGLHTIRVEYLAGVWTDVSDWVNNYSFRYSLSPAKHWKSFDSLEINIDASAFNSSFTTNLGLPESDKKDGISKWHFSNLPADYFEITYVPKISSFANALITIGPVNLTIILSILMVLFHTWGIKSFRNYYPIKKYSWVLIAGSLLVPFFILSAYLYSYEFIDMAIGTEAGKHHGYTFLSMLFYPILFPVYWFLMWRVDRFIKVKMMKKNFQ